MSGKVPTSAGRPMSAEWAVRGHVAAALRANTALAGQVNGVFDGEPARASPPMIIIGPVSGEDWGTKDRAGREVRVSLILVGDAEAGPAEAAAQIEASVPQLRGDVAGWTIVAARIVRTRTSHERGKSWRQQFDLRCRCLAVSR